MKTLKYVPFALAFVVGCAGGEKKEARTAADEAEAGGPPSQADIERAKQEQAQRAASTLPTAAQRKQEQQDRAAFDKLVAKWEEAKKAGLKAADARSLASEFKRLASSKPQLAAQCRFNAGTLLAYAGDEREAEAEYQAALAANPAYGPALTNMGEIYFRQGAVQKAREWFQRGIDADPTRNASAYINLAVILYNEAKETGNSSLYREAVSKLRRALAIDSETMAAYNLLALIYYTTAENDKSKLQLAELVAREGLKVNEKYAAIYNTLGLIQLKKKNVTGALKEFEKAVALDPRYVEAHLNIGAITLSSRQYDKAQKSFEAVLALKPDSVDATIGLGVALRGQRKFDEAETYYKKAQQLDSKNCAVSYNMGVLYQDYKVAADNSNLKQAQDHYRRYVQCGQTVKAKVDDANRRIKDIDDTFAALEQQKRMEEELKKQQEEMERQQKLMEEQQKQQQQSSAAPKS